MPNIPQNEAELDAALMRIRETSRSNLERVSSARERGLRAGILFLFSSSGSGLCLYYLLQSIRDDLGVIAALLGLTMLVPLALLSFARTLYASSQWHQHRALAALDQLSSDDLTIMTRQSDAMVRAREVEDDADSRDLRRLLLVNLVCLLTLLAIEVAISTLGFAPFLRVFRAMAWVSTVISVLGSVTFWLPDRVAKTISRRVVSSNVIRERRRVLDTYEVAGGLQVARDDDVLHGALSPSSGEAGGLEVLGLDAPGSDLGEVTSG